MYATQGHVIHATKESNKHVLFAAKESDKFMLHEDIYHNMTETQ